MSRYKAYIVDDWQGDPFTHPARLIVVDKESRPHSILASDGTFRLVPEGSVVTGGDVGIILPREAIEAIAVAIEQYQGHASHADTEARVLREWLAVEQQRVDEALKR